MIEANASTARFVALTNCFVQRKVGWQFVVLAIPRQFWREIAIQVSRARSGNGPLKLSQVIYYLGKLSHGYLGLGVCSFGYSYFFFFCYLTVGKRGLVWGGWRGGLVSRNSYLGVGVLGGVFS